MISIVTYGNKIMRQIDEAAKHTYGEWHAYLPPGISEISPASLTLDCEGYALGRTGIMNRLPVMFPEIDTPEEGDVVLYRGMHKKTVLHVGIYQKDGTVISKWGWGPVLKHPVEYVPTCYGDLVLFRRIRKEELQKLH